MFLISAPHENRGGFLHHGFGGPAGARFRDVESCPFEHPRERTAGDIAVVDDQGGGTTDGWQASHGAVLD
jgi:hypothetical protein